MKNQEQAVGLFKLQNGAVYTWAEAGSSIMIKAVMGNGDPVELNAEEAIELAEKLIKLAKLVE